ncbi:hypothetical protein KAK06_01810 [Ideonella sp. 4Y11]|uniref:DUF5666 domain-containing protein n=1 Tax=Ideonella aquatica TaxID=2824119 RepID=A0A940YKH0_9BURK|nr:DUF5666 domain-containing protein [Ideonella aquatica]MBQ0957683.1 hypothetical protein [Ideonella aquatica]
MVRIASRSSVPAAARRQFLGRLSALTLSLGLAACGGGGGGGGNDDSGNTGGSNPAVSFTSGVISGFGSIIVNGVRFDDSAATVLDDKGGRLSRDDLRLGAQVEIEGGSIDRASGRATALTIHVGSELKGRVTAVNPGAQSLSMLGQTVLITSTTVFDDSLGGGLSAISVGQLLEVYARYDASQGAYIATRIEREGSSSEFKLRGVVSSLDTSTQTFRIGSAVINYAAVTSVPTTLANGAWLRVRVQPTQVAGQWVATALEDGRHRSGDDRSETEVKGFITAWTSATRFSVDGMPVNADSAEFKDGRSVIVLGAFVEVEGALRDGVLVAREVKLEDDDDGHHGEDFELHGQLSGLDTVNQRFTLRGVSVDYSQVSEWRDLSEASLVDGLRVEVKGGLSSDGNTLMAWRISRED